MSEKIKVTQESQVATKEELQKQQLTAKLLEKYVNPTTFTAELGDSVTALGDAVAAFSIAHDEPTEVIDKAKEVLSVHREAAQRVELIFDKLRYLDKRITEVSTDIGDVNVEATLAEMREEHAALVTKRTATVAELRETIAVAKDTSVDTPEVKQRKVEITKLASSQKTTIVKQHLEDLDNARLSASTLMGRATDALSDEIELIAKYPNVAELEDKFYAYGDELNTKTNAEVKVIEGRISKEVASAVNSAKTAHDRQLALLDVDIENAVKQLANMEEV